MCKYHRHQQRLHRLVIHMEMRLEGYHRQLLHLLEMWMDEWG